MSTRHSFLRLLEDFLHRTRAAKVGTVAAQSAYYLILSTFPLLILIMRLLQSTPFFQDESFLTLLQIFPEAVQEVLIPRIHELSNGTTIAPLAAISVIYIASGGLMPITKGLNHAAGDLADRRGFLGNRLISLLLTIALLTLIVATIATQLVGPNLIVKVLHFLGLNGHVPGFWRFFFPLLTIILMFCFHVALYRLSIKSPASRAMRLQEVWPGAILSTFSIILVTWAFRFYANNIANYTLIYGSIAGLMMLCIWFFLMSAIMLYGGLFNMSLAHLRTGHYPIDPADRFPIPFLSKN